MRRMKTHLPHTEQGQVGVHRVVSELLALGHEPYLPVVDRGIDVLLRSGIRIQVKSTRRATAHWRQVGRLNFTLTNSQVIRKKKYVKAQPRKFSEQCDFVILWAIDPNRFWVVPAAVLDGRCTVSIGDDVQWRQVDIEAARRMREQGLSYDTIASNLGCTGTTIKRRLNGSFVAPKRNLANLNQYENRWDLIDQYLGVLTEANALAQLPDRVADPLLKT